MSYVLWVKALHVFSVIAWMAGMLYLPRLFVYHADAPPGSDKAETFKIMERRLLRGIMNPAMIATWVFGVWTLIELRAWTEPWMHVKLAAVVALTILHHVYARWRITFERDENTRSAGFFRVWNEVPAVLVLLIVVMVVVKPF